jgi:acetoin utilization deacetylase AcuC-like enzyme
MAPTQGFCIFNNVAIGSAYALSRGARRVAVLDVDVHHGNGTQEIFYDDPRVLYISLHQDPATLYPGTGFIEEIGEGEGEGYNVNIPLPPLSGDDVYGRALDEIVWPMIREFRPSIIIVSLGFDAHEGDPMANMRLSLNSYLRIYRGLREYGVGVVYALEGGYNYEVLSAGSRLLVETMNGANVEAAEEPTVTNGPVLRRGEEVIREVKETLRSRWSLD